MQCILYKIYSKETVNIASKNVIWKCKFCVCVNECFLLINCKINSMTIGKKN